MKIAVLLSGQPRYIKKYAPELLNNLIIPNNADVYCHSWLTDPNKPFRTGRGWKNEKIEQDAHDDILKIYNPKKYSFEPEIIFPTRNIDWTTTHNKGYGSPEAGDEVRTYFNNGYYSMWNSIMKCHNLKDQYEIENHILYDVVIRCRFDLGLHEVIDITQYDLNNKIWTKEHATDELRNDWFFFGNNINMRLICNIYNSIDYLYNRYNIFVNEFFFKKTCDIFNIETPIKSWNITLESRAL